MSRDIELKAFLFLFGLLTSSQARILAVVIVLFDIARDGAARPGPAWCFRAEVFRFCLFLAKLTTRPGLIRKAGRPQSTASSSWLEVEPDSICRLSIGGNTLVGTCDKGDPTESKVDNLSRRRRRRSQPASADCSVEYSIFELSFSFRECRSPPYPQTEAENGEKELQG